MEWFDSQSAIAARFQQLRSTAALAEAAVYSGGGQDGWCAACRRYTQFRLPAASDGNWINLRESLLCECGMNSRMRMIFAALDETPPQERFLMFERVTPLYARVKDRYPFVEGCEYFGPDVAPGELRRIGGTQVQHENMLSLSYPDRTFRYLFHGDVLEHVPDMRQALAECLRVLSVGGTLLFTCPMTNLANHVVRARLRGSAIEHLLPAAYHGNPMDAGGALVFNEPGLQLLQDLRDTGFDAAWIGLAFDARQGILRDGNPYSDYNMWPVIFRAQRLR